MIPPITPPVAQPKTVVARTKPAYWGISAYCAASSSWPSANPTATNSAKISNPSNSQPRFEAINTHHCSLLSERYQGSDAMVVLLSIPRLSPVRGSSPSVQAAEPDRCAQKYTLTFSPAILV